MIGWLILATYVVGWFPAAVRITRLAALRPRCHREGSPYRWNQSNCNRYHRSACWRTDSRPGVEHLAVGVGAAFVWPLAALAGAVYFAASGPVAPARLLSEAEIDRMERDLGIGGKS